MENEVVLNRSLLKLSWPILVELLFFNLIGAIDTLMLTSYDDKKVAAVGNANTLINFLVVMFAIASAGINIVVSQYLGSKKKEEARDAFRVGVAFNLGCGLLIFLLIQIFARDLFRLIGTPEEIFESAASYLKIVSFALPLIAITSALSANLRANGKPHYIMITAIFANLVNIALNYCLIYGNFGLPELGSDGAAIATLVCHCVSFACGIFATRVVLKIKIICRKINMASLKTILRIGAPSALESICYNIMIIISMGAVNALHTDAVTARSLLYLILGFIYQFSIAFGLANQILVGYSVGEGNYNKARKGTYFAFYITLPAILAIVLIINIVLPHVVPEFVDNTVVVDMMISVLPILFLLELGRCVNIIYISALKAAGDVIFPLEAALVSMFLFGALGSWALAVWWGLGIKGIFIAYALDECFRGIIMLIRFKGKKWERFGLVKQSSDQTKEFLI